VITIVVRGTPAPQGSKRHLGNGVMVESSKHVKPWRDAVRSDAAAVRDALPFWTEPLDGPLVVDMVFTLHRPRGHYRTGREAGSHIGVFERVKARAWQDYCKLTGHDPNGSVFDDWCTVVPRDEEIVLAFVVEERDAEGRSR
jgi:hypothetical protein